jgi:hypothetical protein
LGCGHGRGRSRITAREAAADVELEHGIKPTPVVFAAGLGRISIEQRKTTFWRKAMNKQGLLMIGVLSLAAAGAAPAADQPKKTNMTFFVTSKGVGNGADLGGLAGADKHCQALASAVGAGNRTWRAYLSTTPAGGAPAVNARDRIGKGPWRNAKGVVIARDVDELHYDNKLSKETSLTEKGETVNGRGENPTLHDMLTGSDSSGRAIDWSGDTTCGNWTKSGAGSAMLGHHDRKGFRSGAPGDDPASRSWNSAHASRGCSQDALRSTGGAGLMYCFAAK